MKTKLATAFLIFFLFLSCFLSINISSVSAQTNQIYWGAWVGTESRMPLSTIQAFESNVGKGLAIWNWEQWWIDSTDSTHDPNFNFAWMNECRSHGSIPMVSWAPSSILIPGTYNGYSDILSGKFDAYLDQWGKDSAAWGHPYFVRLEWEFNGQWAPNTQTPWANGGTPALFVAQWQYIVNRVRAAGGTQISWIWCPAQCMEPESQLQTVYPGDQYVDWVGTDVYSTLDHAQTYLNEIRQIAPDKPVMLPEIGYSPADGNTYWNNILTNELPNKYPYIKAVCYWASDQNDVVTTYPLFKNGLASSYYASNQFSSISSTPILPLGSVTPTPTQSSVPTWNPTPSLSPTFSSVPVKSSGFDVTDVAIVVIVAAMVFVAVAQKKNPKKIKPKKKSSSKKSRK